MERFLNLFDLSHTSIVSILEAKGRQQSEDIFCLTHSGGPVRFVSACLASLEASYYCEGWATVRCGVFISTFANGSSKWAKNMLSIEKSRQCRSLFVFQCEKCRPVLIKLHATSWLNSLAAARLAVTFCISSSSGKLQQWLPACLATERKLIGNGTLRTEWML